MTIALILGKCMQILQNKHLTSQSEGNMINFMEKDQYTQIHKASLVHFLWQTWQILHPKTTAPCDLIAKGHLIHVG